MVSSLGIPSWLRSIEQLVDSSAPEYSGAEFPGSQFYCVLDDQPDHLAPRRPLNAGLSWQQPQQPMIVNPGCIFTRAGELPEVDLGDSAWMEAFASFAPMVWVRDAWSRILQPFWLGPRVAAALKGASPGQAAPAGLPADILATLKLAGVAVSADAACREISRERATRSFTEKGYVPLPNLLNSLQVSALRRYYRYMVRTGGMTFGDHQTSRRYFIHNEPVARFFHHQLTALVSYVAGEPLKPSYVYVASYKDGAVLRKHTDREQCEYSVSLCIDYAPEPAGATPWPLRLHTSSSVVDVFQGLGDALFYRGRRLAHSRGLLPRGHSSTSMFFHFVGQDFGGSLD